MPKDPTKNIQSYQIQGGHVNEFEYQQSQGEMAHEAEPELPFTSETDSPQQTQAEHVAEVTAAAHRKVEKLRKRGLVKTPARKKSVKKVAKKTTRKASRKSTTRAPKKAATRRGAKKRATVKKGRTSARKKR